MTRIIRLESENVKRLRAVSITPDNDVVVIGGKNGQGKSSVLDSILYALGGGKTLPTEPIRRGEKSARIVLELDDLIVKRGFTESGRPTLQVESKDGARYSKPQEMLDALVGSLSFDPHGLIRMKPQEQAQVLRHLLGVDFTELDARRAKAYADRTDVNREVKRLEARLAAMPLHEDAPAKEVSVADLMQELEQAQAVNRAAGEATSAVRGLEQRIGQAASQVKQAQDHVRELERQLEAARKELAEREHGRDKLEQDLEAATVKAAEMPTVDCQPIHDRITNAEAINRKVRENGARFELDAELEEQRAQAEKLTESIEAIDADKASQLQSAEFPVDGLTFNDTGVLLNGLPFDQASSAEQLRVSVAMGIAMNPKLRVLLVRDGSLLDPDSLGVLREMAAEHDVQVWLEKVGDGAEVSILIEDGMVKEMATA